MLLAQNAMIQDSVVTIGNLDFNLSSHEISAGSQCASPFHSYSSVEVLVFLRGCSLVFTCKFARGREKVWEKILQFEGKVVFFIIEKESFKNCQC